MGTAGVTAAIRLSWWVARPSVRRRTTWLRCSIPVACPQSRSGSTDEEQAVFAAAGDRLVRVAGGRSTLRPPADREQEVYAEQRERTAAWEQRMGGGAAGLRWDHAGTVVLNNSAGRRQGREWHAG